MRHRIPIRVAAGLWAFPATGGHTVRDLIISSWQMRWELKVFGESDLRSGAYTLFPGELSGEIGARFWADGRELRVHWLERGAARVYATARGPRFVDVPGADVMRVDITGPGSVAAAASEATDVTLLVNNACVSTFQNLVSGDLEKIRLEMETNFFGTLGAVRAFAPLLAANGGGAVLNVLSAMSWLSYDGANAYNAAKAAEWSLTNGIRLELADQGTLVTGLHLASTDTDSARLKADLSADPSVLYPQLASVA